ncbi:MAG: putative lipid II flippase FtsW [Syntrophorhabdaceae bacterium]|nr:putative lipid II flippase FtsW [Syntrophorhabdaceae bacterium]
MTFGKRTETMILVFCTLSLTVLGLLMIYSATNVMAGSSARFGHDPAYFFKRQIFFLTLGISLAVFLSRVDYDFYRRHIRLLLVGTFLVLMLVFVPGINHTANGASRWIDLRLIFFQPSEMAKFVLLLYAAYAIDRKGENPREGLKAFLPMLLLMGIFVAVILKEPDFGMAVVITISFFVVIFLAGFPWKLLVGMAVAVALAAVTLVVSTPYRLARFKAFMDPFSQAQTGGYQVLQSLIAFSNGGFLGVGIGGGKQKLFYLPEMHTDYIISVIGEELGFAGVALTGACFISIAWVGFRIARRARDPFGKYLAMGFSVVIGIQALMNMMVGLKMLPPKGMVLPFLSYGGSSLIMHLAAIGILMNVSRKGADAFVAENDRSRRRDWRARFPRDCSC